jgi:hypothetical protein
VVALYPDRSLMYAGEVERTGLVVRGKTCVLGWPIVSEAITVSRAGQVTCADVETHGARCKPGAPIELSSGTKRRSLRSCTLAQPFDVVDATAKRTLPVGALVHFDDDGKPIGPF